MSTPGQAALYAGADNRFLLFETQAELEWPELARELCSRELFHGAHADGLLVVSPSARADACMTIYNADGGRPEACGNGLRCVGWHLARTRDGEAWRVETDAGLRGVRVESRGSTEAILCGEMGHARVTNLTEPIPVDVRPIAARGYDLGNPHCILHVADERVFDVEDVGRAMQAHTDFPRGVNVGFLSEREGEWHLRVWERGVGETAACGTNACAAAAYLASRDGARERAVHMRGGVLRISRLSSGSLELRGAASFFGELDLADAKTLH